VDAGDQRRGSAPSLRVGHSLIPLSNRLLLFGGDPVLHCFDLQQRRWSDLAVDGEQPRACTLLVAIPCRGGVLIFGGRGSGNERLNSTFLLCVRP